MLLFFSMVRRLVSNVLRHNGDVFNFQPSTEAEHAGAITQSLEGSDPRHLRKVLGSKKPRNCKVSCVVQHAVTQKTWQECSAMLRNVKQCLDSRCG